MAFESKRIKPEDRAEFLRLARERYTYVVQADQEDRDLAQDDVRFAVALPVPGAGTTQWKPGAAQRRIAAHLPVLTENRLPTFTAQVVNDGRQSKPSIRISAMDNGTKETAEYYQGRIRQVEYDCNADTSYDTAREQQVGCGRAFLRVTWDYVPGSMRREARIEPIPNQFSVFFGPSTKYDCSDADYCFVISQVTREQHIRDNGPDITAARIDFASELNPAVGWLGVGANGQMVQKAEYWLKEYLPRTRVLLSNGTESWKDELPEGYEKLGHTIEEEREEQVPTVVQYIIDGADILGETEFIGPYIGIVPWWGREWFVDGVRRTQSLIRYAKDPQRLLNLYVSNIAQQIAQMPKVPFQIPVGGIPPGSQAQWDNLNNDNRPYVYYNQYDAEGRPLNPPTREVQEPPIQALVAGYNQAVDAIKAAMGIFDASLGARSNETSGIAIQRREREADNANFHFHDNEARSRNHVGRILLHLISHTDQGKVWRAVRSENGKSRMVRVGEPWQDPDTGKNVHHKLRGEDYGVAVDTGPSYNSQRQQAFDTYSQIAKADPRFMQVAGDKVFRAMDAPGSEEIADRYEKLLPPGLQPQKPGQTQVPPEVMQQFQTIQKQASDLIERLTAEVHRLQADMDAQVVQTASRERIAALQEETKRLVALGNWRQGDAIALLESELAAIKHRVEMGNAQADREHAMALDDAERGHQMAMAAGAGGQGPGAGGQGPGAGGQGSGIGAAGSPPPEQAPGGPAAAPPPMPAEAGPAAPAGA